MSEFDSPLVSVVLPCFNHANYVQDSISSILAQTYPRLELIILDDGSTDSSRDRINAMITTCAQRCERFETVFKANEGISKTLNAGIRWAQGTYILLLATDDMLEPDALEKLVNALELGGTKTAVASGDATYMDAQGKRLYLDQRGAAHAEPGPGRIGNFIDSHTRNRYDFDVRSDEFGRYETFLRSNYVPPGYLLRRDALLDVGLYTEEALLEDIDMWLKLAKRYRFVFIGDVVARYRWHASNTSKSNALGLRRDRMRILRREKAFCLENGFERHWYDAWIGSLVLLVYNRQWKLFLTYLQEMELRVLFSKSTMAFMVSLLSRLWRKGLPARFSTIKRAGS